MQIIGIVFISVMLSLSGCSNQTAPKGATEQPVQSSNPSPSAPPVELTEANDTLPLKPLGTAGEVASYYNRHLAIKDGAVYGWTDNDQPQIMMDDAIQIGVGDTTSYALLRDGQLIAWTEDPKAVVYLAKDIASFSAGRTGVFAIKNDGALWRYDSPDQTGVEIAKDVVFSSIGDGTDYYITKQREVFARGLAHRGQYGDGRLESTKDFIKVASDATQVKGHTGHVILLQTNGDVLGTGGNIYGPLSTHGLGDKAITWGVIFTGASHIATGSSHSVAIKEEGTLWIWGANEGTKPHQVMDQVVAAAAGKDVTLVKTRDGGIWFWQTGMEPRKIL
ncbi:hypothetical protein GC093_15785 [Paenibacillus sp. LMG 31456]|uniref:Chromosome condensation regulator n=1 Tax=Paenibacillus foliorum TaxID=2654974 RepID=A0A972GR64_9BACL|nr:hypothetical protein [Paenibacillus foliorum]NOU94670.1 hypothetical protein [Paenibacillus foliorum]